MQRTALLLSLAGLSLFLAETLAWTLVADPGRARASDGPGQDPQTGPGADQGDLRRSLDLLRTEIGRLQEALGRASPGPEQRVPDLEPLLARLAKAAESLATGQPVRIEMTPPAPGEPLLIPPPPDPQRTKALAGLDNDALVRAHRFWSLQAVLLRYGQPDFIGADGNGEIIWYYPSPRGDEQPFRFVFLEGRVISAGQ